MSDFHGWLCDGDIFMPPGLLKVDSPAFRIDTSGTMGLTLANKITLVRIVLVPFMVVHVHYYAESGTEIHRLLAIAAFALAVISDGLDGYIARHYNQRSDLGAVLDPMADKLLLVLSLVALTVDNRPHLYRLPFWLTAIVLSRDVILTIGLAAIHYTGHKPRVQPGFIGKLASVLVMAVVLWTLLKWDENGMLYVAMAAAACTIISGFQYAMDGLHQIASPPDNDAGNPTKS